MRIVTGINVIGPLANSAMTVYSLRFKRTNDEVANKKWRIALERSAENTIEQAFREYLYGSFWRAIRTAWNGWRGKPLYVAMTEVTYGEIEVGEKICVEATWRMDLTWNGKAAFRCKT